MPGRPDSQQLILFVSCQYFMKIKYLHALLNKYRHTQTGVIFAWTEVIFKQCLLFCLFVQFWIHTNVRRQAQFTQDAQVDSCVWCNQAAMCMFHHWHLPSGICSASCVKYVWNRLQITNKSMNMVTWPPFRCLCVQVHHCTKQLCTVSTNWLRTCVTSSHLRNEFLQRKSLLNWI